MAASSPNYVLIHSNIARDPSATGSASDVSGSASSGYVRRPTRGIEIKKEVFATLSVVGASTVALHNASTPTDKSVNFTSNFLLQAVSEQRQEKFQPITTFGAPYGFFFGEQPRMVNFSAILLNTADFQWEAEWWANYDEFLRGTRLVDRGVRAALEYEDTIIEGYITQASTSKSEPTPWAVNLQFTMWVTGAYPLIDVGGHDVDTFHAGKRNRQGDRTGSQASEFINLGSDDTSAGPTMEEEVRARNIAALANGETGLIGALRSAVGEVSDFVGKVGAKIDSALDWLYGRNLVIPAGFAGSERITGLPVFANGSEVHVVVNGDQISVTAGMTVRTPVKVLSVVERKGNFYDDNVDEYPTRWADGPRFSNSSETFRQTGEKDPSIALAEAMFSNFGINVMNSEGQHTSELMQALGSASFVALSYAGSVLSAQDASNLSGTSLASANAGVKSADAAANAAALAALS